MRQAPPLQFRVGYFGRWHAFVLLLAASACASVLAWWWAQPAPASMWVGLVTVLAGLVALACAATLWRAQPLTLRWDRQSWWLAHDGVAEQAGTLAVAIDLGSWMLLRFVAEDRTASPAWRGRVVWIAIQRSALQAQWHAIRCAVYGARPALQPSDV